ncbi:hypothetical protein U1Q18_017499, partial [Sarracenia purpurea var. burkii]
TSFLFLSHHEPEKRRRGEEGKGNSQNPKPQPPLPSTTVLQLSSHERLIHDALIDASDGVAVHRRRPHVTASPAY